jgi:hypothetical protein
MLLCNIYNLMLPLVPPAHPDAVIADEEAEAEAVACPIPLSSTPCWPSCSFVLVVNHQCRPSTSPGPAWLYSTLSLSNPPPPPSLVPFL